MVSDLLAPTVGYQKSLNSTNRRHDLIAVQISDPLESEIPSIGIIAMEDVETGRTVWVDSSDPAWRQQHAAVTNQRDEELTKLFRRSGVDRVQIESGEDYVRPLTEFFQKRSQRKSR